MFSMSAQDLNSKWDVVNSLESQSLPQSALEVVNEIYREALKTNNSPELIKAIMHQIKYETAIDADKVLGRIAEIEQFAKQTNNKVQQAVLYSLLAELYQGYYQANSWQINQRTAIAGDAPEDIREWSGNLFVQKITDFVHLSLAPAKELQNTNVLDYRIILIEGDASRNLRPTLYDFLLWRGIETLNTFNNNWGGAQNYFPQTKLTNVNYFAPVKEFVELNLQAEDYDFAPQILKLYQDLLTFRLKENNEKALLMADLDRLNFVRDNFQGENAGENFLNALSQLLEQHEEEEFSVEIMFQKANHFIYYLRFGYESENTDALRQAYLICTEGIKKFPNYERIGLLKNLLNDITQSRISVNAANTVYPGENLDLKINYRNLDKLTVEIYKINAPITIYGREMWTRGGQFKKNGKLIQEYTIALSNEYPYLNLDTIFQIPMRELGSYEYVIYGNDNDVDDLLNQQFSVSRLATIARVVDGRREILVVDRNSGEPISGIGANVNFFKFVRNLKFYKSAEINHLGLAWGEYGRDITLYNASYKNDTSLLLSPVPWIPTNYSTTNNERANLSLFTDRSIYRPGQTVYFKGIAYQIRKNSKIESPPFIANESYTPQVVANRKYKITFRDANNKEIATKTFTTNEFGSFSGEFVIPQGRMNGSFSIQSNQDGERVRIRVEEYKRPTFDIQFQENTETYRFGDEVVIKGNAKTFSGVNVQDADVRYVITQQSDMFARIWRNPVQVAAGNVQTKEDGSFEIRFAPERAFEDRDRNNIIYSYQIEATITHTNGETQNRQTQIRIGNRSMFLSIAGLSDLLNKDNFSPVTINAMNLSWVPVAIQGKWEIFSLKAKDKNQMDLKPEDWIQDKLVLSGKFDSNQTLDVSKLQSLTSGRYRIVAKANDDSGLEVETQQDFTLFSPQDKRPPVPVYEWIMPIKTECTVGENAEIHYGSSAKNVFVLYEIFQDGKRLSATRFVLNNEIKKIEIPFLASYKDGISVSFTFIKDKQIFTQNVTITRKQLDKNLKLNMEVFRDKLLPGQQEEWKISIKDAENKPVSAELLATMYDASLDKIVNHSWRFSPLKRINIWSVNNQRGNEFNFFFDETSYPEREHNIPSFQFDAFNWFRFYSSNIVSSLAGKVAGVQVSPPSATSPIMIRGNSSVASVEGVDIRDLQDHAVVVQDNAFITESAVVSLTPIENKAVFSDDAGGGQPEVQIRQNFNETAFFYPQLKTNELGETVIAFTVPESNTTWKLMGLAHTKDLKFGQIIQQAISQKQLMVAPNVPRFIREGDKMTITSNISNLSEEIISGTVTIECFDPNTNQTNIVIANASQDFSVELGRTISVSWTFDVPSGIELTTLKIVAKSANYSDGEQHLLPVLPNRMMLTESLPLNVSGGETRTFNFERINNPSPTLEHFRLTLEMTTNPTWYAVQALPSITTPQTDNVLSWFAAYYSNAFATHIANSTPKIKQMIDIWTKQGGTKETLLSNLEKNQELKVLLLEETPWVLTAQNETEQKQQLALLFNLNRAANLNNQAIEKLRSFQLSDGGWTWFKGMNSSVSITQWILYGLGNMTQQNIISPEDNKDMRENAIRFIDQEMKKHFDNFKKNNPNWEKSQTISTYPIEYLYVRSFYPDIPLVETKEAADFYTNILQKHWAKNGNLYTRSLAAVILQRKGDTQMAQAIMKSLREHASNKRDFGMFWANNNNSAFMTQSAVSVHTFIMEAFHEVGTSEKEMDAMKLWLLKQKQTQMWESVPATVNSINILLKTGTDWLSSEGKVTVQLGNTKINTEQREAGTGFFREVFDANSITPEMSKITVAKTDAGSAWGAVYWQYFEDLDKITAAKTELNVEKTLFVEQVTSTGRILVPITENAPIKVGDKVTVRLTVRTDRDMEFVALKDMRASCFEPVDQLSGVQWKQGLMYYQSPRDASMNFFFSAMPKGTYVFEYNLFATATGDYSNGITTIQSMYAPEFISHTSGGRVIVFPNTFH
jgi:hypothetical protein